MFLHRIQASRLIKETDFHLQVWSAFRDPRVGEAARFFSFAVGDIELPLEQFNDAEERLAGVVDELGICPSAIQQAMALHERVLRPGEDIHIVKNTSFKL